MYLTAKRTRCAALILALALLCCMALTGCSGTTPQGPPSQAVTDQPSAAPAPSASPTDPATPEPTPEKSPDPTVSPDPSSEPTSEPTPEPTPTPTPKPTPKPTPSPVSTETTSPAAGGGTYLLRVNKTTNVVTAYTWDGSGEYTIPVRAMTCSTGPNTPSGTYAMMVNKHRWGALIHNSWGQYTSRIVGSILFHTVPALAPQEDMVEVAEFNKLGTTASAGCVRLTTVDCYWIYVNCKPYETIVEIGYFGEDADPLGKPAVIKLPTDTETNWDPYDISPDNPWNEKSPWLEGVHGFSVYVPDMPDGPDWLEGVTGYDTCGNDWSEYIQVDASQVDLTTSGQYTVYYSMTDLLDRTATASASVVVIVPEEIVPLDQPDDPQPTLSPSDENPPPGETEPASPPPEPSPSGELSPTTPPPPPEGEPEEDEADPVVSAEPDI